MHLRRFVVNDTEYYIFWAYYISGFTINIVGILAIIGYYSRRKK